MAEALASQLNNTTLGEASSDTRWKDQLKAPAKDARPQTEVCYHQRLCLRLQSLTPI